MPNVKKKKDQRTLGLPADFINIAEETSTTDNVISRLLYSLIKCFLLYKPFYQNCTNLQKRESHLPIHLMEYDYDHDIFEHPHKNSMHVYLVIYHHTFFAKYISL